MPPQLLLDVMHRQGLSAHHLRLADATADDTTGIHVLTISGSEVASLDQLRASCGAPARWRKPTVASVPLSPREQVVEELVRQGHSTARIASLLGLSDRTVTSARQQIRSKVLRADTPSATEKVAVLGRNGLLRDLVHDCLVAAGIDVGLPGASSPRDLARVFVLPNARDLDHSDGVHFVAVGTVPQSIGVVGAFQRGMTALLPVYNTADLLCWAVHESIEGRAMLSSQSAQQLLDELWCRRASSRSLSKREQEVLTAIQANESTKQTARRLGISQKTVDNTRQNVYRKLGVRSAHEARARPFSDS